MSYTKEQARAEIAHLVAHFRANEPSLVNVPEAQIEDNYIRNLFRFLNWNTDNTGLSVAEWEFVLQRTDEKGKRPDYLLQLDGQQVLVMDAKKVKYDMHDPRWITQVYAYAYSTQSQPASRKIDFAILTDFQEFILLDCTLYAADLRAVSNFRILDWTYEDYVSQFDTLWELLERENVRAAIYTRNTQKPSGLWSRYLSPKKVKANRIPPDKTFLAEMDDENTGWRVRLAKDMKKRNPQADGALITAAVQLLIDRLIFVKVLSDREIEADYLIQLAEKVEKSGLATDDAGWFNACRDIFAKLNQFYNGSIFEPRPELEAVTVSNKVVREIIRDLQPENSPYNFAVLPVEILGTIYERFLGRVVRATDQRVKIEDKPEVRKAGGVYYTPQYIVDYIVENTVGKLLSECKTPADAAKLHILDPACGSGSFLLGAYSALIRWHEAYYSDKEQLTQRDREAAYYDSDGRVRLTAKLKRQILLNNLFGVDIDAQAVEVTRFSLSLKALEDTRRDELYEERTLFKQTVLPDLRHNIKCGNSLIGPDYFTDQMFTDKGELLRVRPFDWATEFFEVMQKGGFDCVIGNPPWGAEYSQTEKEHLRNKYSDVHVRTPESFNYFIAQAWSLTRYRGIVGAIVPSSFLNQHEFWQTRKILVETTFISRVCNLGDGVFQGVTAPSCIVIFAAQKQLQALYFDFRKTERGALASALLHEVAGQDASHIGKDSESFTLQVRNGLQIIQKCYSWPKLRDIAEDVATGISSDLDTAYVYKPQDAQRLELEKKLLRKLVIGGEIHRYALTPTSGKQIIYATPETKIDEYPNIHAALLPYHAQLKKRREAANGQIPWYSLNWPRRRKLFDETKILIRQTANRILATLDTDQWYCLKSAIIVQLSANSTIQYKYLLGILNSRLMCFLYDDLVGEQARVFPEVKPVQLFKLPIRPINFTDPADKARHDRMVQLVESMLALHKHKAAARTQAEQEQFQRQITATDRQIDLLVYELYDLTPEEIAVVTGQT